MAGRGNRAQGKQHAYVIMFQDPKFSNATPESVLKTNDTQDVADAKIVLENLYKKFDAEEDQKFKNEIRLATTGTNNWLTR